MFLIRNELGADELARRYGSADAYIAAYDSATDKLVAERWLLPEDALRLKAKTREDALRQFRNPGTH